MIAELTGLFFLTFKKFYSTVFQRLSGLYVSQKTYLGTAWSVNLLDICFIVAVEKKVSMMRAMIA